MNADIIADKYHVLSELGRGGMGHVYKVQHRGLHKIFALKILRDHLVEDESLVARFHGEARIMASLQHRNIVQVFDIDRDADRHYFVMEYIEGQTLGDALKDRAPLPLADVIATTRQIAHALAYAHQQQPPIIHRDIKPSNIMLENGTGRIVVTDFGIAKLLDADRTRQTLTGFTVGTPAYAAPEQLRSSSDLDARADIFPLGLVMYEMLAGRALFEDMTPEEIIGQKLYDPRELAPVFDASIPTPLQRIIQRAIAKNRDERYPSAAALLDDLKRFESGATIPSTRPHAKASNGRYWVAGIAATILAGYLAWPLLQRIAAPPKPVIPEQTSNKPISSAPTTAEPASPEPASPVPASPEPATVEPAIAESTIAESTIAEPATPEPVVASNLAPVLISSEPSASAINLVSGDSQTFSAEAVDPDETPVFYQWFLDEQSVAISESWHYQPTSETSGSHTVRLEVSDDANAKIERSWQVTISAPEPTPSLDINPATNQLSMMVCSQQAFRVKNATAFDDFQWSMNSQVQTQNGPQFSFGPQTPGQYKVDLQAHVISNNKTLKHQWQIQVIPAAISETDVNAWLASYQQALQSQDIQALRRFNLYSESELSQIRERQRYQLTLEQWNAVANNDQVDLSFNQIERWYNPQTYSSVVEHTSHTLTLKRQGCDEVLAVWK